MTLVICAHMPRTLASALHVQYQFIIGFWPRIYSDQMMFGEKKIFKKNPLRSFKNIKKTLTE